MRAPDSNEKGAPHTEHFPDLPTAPESSRQAKADARTPLRLPIVLTQCVRKALPRRGIGSPAES